MNIRYLARRDKRIFSVAVSSLLIFTGALSYAAQARPQQVMVKEAPSSEAAQEEYVGQKVLSFNLEGFSEKGDKKWDIQGESAETIQGDRIKLNNIIAKTYGDEAQATLKADKGIYDKSKNNVILEENVKVTINNSEKFANQYADFPLASQEAGKDDKKPSETVITCEGEVEFNYEANTANFSKSVRVISADGVIEADKITVYLDLKTKKMKEVVAEGNVKIVRGDNTSYSEKATYIEADKKVVLSGNPKIVFYQGSDAIGDKFFGK